MSEVKADIKGLLDADPNTFCGFCGVEAVHQWKTWQGVMRRCTRHCACKTHLPLNRDDKEPMPR